MSQLRIWTQSTNPKWWRFIYNSAAIWPQTCTQALIIVNYFLNTVFASQARAAAENGFIYFGEVAHLHFQYPLGTDSN